MGGIWVIELKISTSHVILRGEGIKRVDIDKVNIGELQEFSSTAKLTKQKYLKINFIRYLFL